MKNRARTCKSASCVLSIDHWSDSSEPRGSWCLLHDPDFKRDRTHEMFVCVCVWLRFLFLCLKTISSKIPLCRTTAVMWGPNPIFFPPPFFFSIPGDCEVPLFKVGHASKFWERATTMSALLSSFHLLWLWTAISSIWTPVILTFKVSFSSRHFLWTLSTHIYLSLLVCLPGYELSRSRSEQARDIKLRRFLSGWENIFTFSYNRAMTTQSF